VLVAPPAQSTSAAATPSPTDGAALASSKPTSLEIPSISVRTGRIIDLSLLPDGALQVPPDAGTVGWFTGAPTPGEAGPAVLAAHVDYKRVPGVFVRLKQLHQGEQVTVGRADGRTAVFTVYQVDRYSKTSFPTDRVYGDTPGPELRLITCGGAFDHSSGNYLDNVVVYARLTAVRD
jgi:sortase (surface protein transpeptidase)